MWLLDNPEAFQNRQLWLRPGKTYLFGRTVAEPGQLAISHNTISRKHLAITIDKVEDGQVYHPASRSTLTMEDLATKMGTVVNGKKIKGKKYVLQGESAELTMGKCPHKFRITWHPVVFSFSFTKKELQNQPLRQLQEKFEQLDIKLVTEYAKSTTHVVSKKRNTAKGLQALINGRYIVSESFLDSIIEASSIPENGDGTESSPLENDFEASWPDAMQHLPPPGGEPVQPPDSAYVPDLGRKDIFEGYTFIFYDKSQYDNLLAPITSGGGKALLGDVEPDSTEVDEFVQYVKNVAGEKGLGAFDDGSEGKGVVLVRYLPSKGSLVKWYTEFFTAVSLRLDHRPIEQSEFLEAILIKDASILRRPLEVESMPNTQEQQEPAIDVQPNPVPERIINNIEPDTPAPEPVKESQPAPRRGRTRRTVKRRFAGFDDDADIDMGSTPTAPAPEPESHPPVQEESGLFVSQDPDPPPPQEKSSNNRRSQRKRHASPLPEDDLMEGMAPAAAKFKRQRLEMGEDLDASSLESKEPVESLEPKKIKKEFDILAMAAQNREQEEARARAEKEDLANLPDDVDLSEIRRLNIVEEMEVLVPTSKCQSRDEDIASGRWNPRWNGIRNFKRFRSQGEVVGRPLAKVIVPLTEVKNKEFGVGDDYWLEDEDSQQRKKQTSQPSGGESQVSAAPPAAPSGRTAQRRVVGVVLSDSSDEETPQTKEPESVPETRTRTRASASQSQGNMRSQSSRTTSQGSKRTAPEPAQEQPPKRQRPARKPVIIADSDDSDDELKFRFGKRR